MHDDSFCSCFCWFLFVALAFAAQTHSHRPALIPSHRCAVHLCHSLADVYPFDSSVCRCDYRRLCPASALTQPTRAQPHPRRPPTDPTTAAMSEVSPAQRVHTHTAGMTLEPISARLATARISSIQPAHMGSRWLGALAHAFIHSAALPFCGTSPRRLHRTPSSPSRTWTPRRAMMTTRLQPIRQQLPAAAAAVRQPQPNRPTRRAISGANNSGWAVRARRPCLNATAHSSARCVCAALLSDATSLPC